MKLSALLVAAAAVSASAGTLRKRTRAAVGGSALPEALVQTPLGTVQGLVLDDARVFMALPYGMPPLGTLRWQPPQPAVAWSPTVLQAIYEPNACPQSCTVNDQPPHVCPQPFQISEDCLYLNVWTPRLASLQEPAPVIIWIHGGNFREGYAGGTQNGWSYDASSWVNTTGAIVVAINYRLGAMGFLYAENSTSIKGNYGLMDQELAMRWVGQNIAAFGGDPTRITIAGQSAGAMSVASHLVRPGGAGLYKAAIMHSNPFTLPFRNVADGTDLANAVALKASCSDGSAAANWTAVELCLRGLDWQDVVTAQVAAQKDLAADWREIMQLFMPYTPTTGTPYLPLHPLESIEAGIIADVPIIHGSNTDEALLFVDFAFNSSLAGALYNISLGVIVGFEHLDLLNSMYPASPSLVDYRPLLSVLGTDGLFTCSNRNVSALLASIPGRQSPNFFYHYTHPLSFNDAAWGPIYPFNQCWGNAVCHGDELALTFRPEYPPLTNYTAAEISLSVAIQQYWTSLAASGVAGAGNPASPLLWPAYDMVNRSTMVFATPASAISSDLNTALCSSWETNIGFAWY